MTTRIRSKDGFKDECTATGQQCHFELQSSPDETDPNKYVACKYCGDDQFESIDELRASNMFLGATYEFDFGVKIMCLFNGKEREYVVWAAMTKPAAFVQLKKAVRDAKHLMLIRRRADARERLAAIAKGKNNG